MQASDSPSISLRLLAASATFGMLLGLAGCHAEPSDAVLTTNVHAALAHDPAISRQPVQVSVQKGVVTLTGNLTDDTASTVAAQDAARVKGVKEVVNSTSVAGIQVAPTVTSPEAPTQPRQTTAQEQQSIAQGQPLPPPTSGNVAPAPPAPVFHDVTAPAGTEIPVRITERLDSQTAQDGESFNGVVTHEVVHDGMVILPAGSAVSGRVVAAKDAGRFKGHSLLSIRLTSVRRHGTLLSVDTNDYTLEGKNRGKNSFEKVGGGAAIGAVLGGIFGGGKGAGIGALAGGGGGAVLQGATHGQQVEIPSESVVRFRLEHSLTVRTSETPSARESPRLHER